MTRLGRHSDAEFTAAVQGAVTYAQISQRLGLKTTGGSSSQSIKMRMAALGLESLTLVGRQGVSHKPRALGFYRVPVDELVDLCYMKERLIREGLLTGKCAECGRAKWRGETLPLELHHVDGDDSNNALDNLRVLCPNCHALTPNWRGRNTRGRKTQTDRLSPEQWAEVVARYAEGGVTQRELAAEYEVSAATVSRAITRHRVGVPSPPPPGAR